ncbi:MAG: 3-deoxy-D-manno-octulosonic acid transferase [bacterium]
MKLIYNLLISLLTPILGFAGLFNKKLKSGNKGRARTFEILSNKLVPDAKTAWFHCASLGEFEQGLPVFEKIIADNEFDQIVLTFFSPSGYEIKKNISWATAVVYLPIDTLKKAQKFVALVQPTLSVFVKYEIWPNYLTQLSKTNSKTILISANFRANQIYFKSYGKFLLTALKTFTHIFVQEETSKTLLNNFNINQVTVSGDTRFDRVNAQLDIDNTIAIIEEFVSGNICIVAGSTWPEDEAFLIPFINANKKKNVKFIIAPHEIDKSHIKQIENSFNVAYAKYSKLDKSNLAEANVLILDTIGILSKVYSYADIAIVGGASGKTGLHNTLEAAVFGIPIGIGKNFSKFPEANAMIKEGGMFHFSTKNEFENQLNKLIENDEERTQMGLLNGTYVRKNKGAVIQIHSFIRNVLR